MPVDLHQFAHRRIKLAQKRIEKAKESKANVVAEIQEECTHAHVAEQPYRGGGCYYPPRRICLVCGREESASSWPSSYATLHEPDHEKGGMKETRIDRTELNNDLVYKVPDVYGYRP